MRLSRDLECASAARSLRQRLQARIGVNGHGVVVGVHAVTDRDKQTAVRAESSASLASTLSNRGAIAHCRQLLETTSAPAGTETRRSTGGGPPLDRADQLCWPRARRGADEHCADHGM